MEPTELTLLKTYTMTTKSLPSVFHPKLVKNVIILVTLVKPEPPICVSLVEKTELLTHTVYVLMDIMKTKPKFVLLVKSNVLPVKLIPTNV